MRSRRGPTLRAQWLGRRLRGQREQARLTLQEAGAHIQRDGSTVSRIEAGIVTPRLPDVIALMDLYRVFDEVTRVGMEKLCSELWRKGWWDGYRDFRSGHEIDLAWLESKADRIRWFECLFVPALMQTPDYARARMTGAEPDAADLDLTRAVEFAMRRQEALFESHPPRLSVVIDESVLHRIVGGRAVMRAQLVHLLSLSNIANIDLRIFPFASGATHLPEAPFSVLTMPYPFPDLAHIGTTAGPVQVEQPECEPLQQAFDRLARAAADPDSSRELIATRADDFG